MSSVTSSQCVLLKQLIERYFSAHLYENARFYCERFYYECPSAESLNLLAKCYFRQGKIKQTYLILQDCSKNITEFSNSPTNKSNKYLFALACVGLDKYDEAERALQPHFYQTSISMSLEALRETPGGAPGVYLLGKICRKQNRKEQSIAYLKTSLLMDPYLWTSIADLAEMGVIVNTEEMFKIPPNTTFSSDDNSGIDNHDGHVSSSNKKSHTNNIENSDPNKPSSSNMEGRLPELNDQQLKLREMGVIERMAFSPPTSMSLGLSSLSLRVPFASPSSMPSPIEFTHHMMHSSAYSHSDTISSNNSGPHISGCSPFASHDREHGSSRDGATRATLFGMPTPSLTPGKGNSTVFSESSVPRPFSMDLHDTGNSHHSGGHTGLTHEFHRTHLGGRDDSDARMGVGGISGIASSDSSHQHNLFGDDSSSGLRRVSFGPTARLSFGFDPEPSQDSLHDDLRPLDLSLASSSGVSESSASAPPLKLQKRSQSSSKTATSSPSSSSSSSINPSPASKSPVKVKPSTPRSLPTRSSTVTAPVSRNMARTRSSDTGDGGSKLAMSPATEKKAGSPKASASKHSITRMTRQQTATVKEKEKEKKKENENEKEKEKEKDKGNGKSKVKEKGKEKQKEKEKDLPSSAKEADGAELGDEAAAHARRHAAGVMRVRRLVSLFSQAQQALSMYRCADCVELLQQLPPMHFRSAHVSQLIGKAYYERNEYRPALLAYREMIRLEPFRLQGLETLSTALWHLKKDRQLSALSQQVVDIDKFAPETWCVVGNCFSLQKEPDTAIRYFKRALQIDPSFTYAHTLCGHEQVNNEDLEQAVASFRQALLSNDRHYNAWYGLGSIFFRQERVELATYHFRRAMQINPASSVLHCYLAMSLHAQGTSVKTDEALVVLSQACERDAKNPQLHFQRAHILVAIGELQEALTALHVVKEHAPKEPHVYALLGQVHQQLGDVQEAILHLNIAIDLDPKQASSLKVLMERIDEPTSL